MKSTATATTTTSTTSSLSASAAGSNSIPASTTQTLQDQTSSTKLNQSQLHNLPFLTAACSLAGRKHTHSTGIIVQEDLVDTFIRSLPDHLGCLLGLYYWGESRSSTSTTNESQSTTMVSLDNNDDDEQEEEKIPLPNPDSLIFGCYVADGHGEASTVRASSSVPEKWTGSQPERFQSILKGLIPDVVCELITEAVESWVKEFGICLGDGDIGMDRDMLKKDLVERVYAGFEQVHVRLDDRLK
ncbi:hypothetical protein HDU76_004289, partial [Blyttiomyces sp. JEL0837]